LAQLETLPHESREFQTLWDALYQTVQGRERAGLKAKNSVEKFRARTIRFHLQRLRNLPLQTATDPEVVLDWLPHEAWYATRALRPGLARIVTAIAALDDTPALDPERAAWALRLFEEERSQLAFDLAERLATALYRRRPDADSVERLARVHTWRGDLEATRTLLTEALAATTDDAFARRAYLARARAESAFVDERAALADYGAALAFGSVEAARDLGTRALVEEDRDKALFLAECVLREAPLDEEALTETGLALLTRVTNGLEDGAREPMEKSILGVEKPVRRNSVPSGN
jgi:hypothetical protein